MLPVHGQQMGVGQEAVHLIGRDLVLAQTMKDDKQMIVEIVDLGQVTIVDGVAHAELIKPEFVG